jgi:hypothetical protein
MYSMPNRKNQDRQPASSREQVIAKAKQRFAEADVQIADLKEQGAKERRRVERSKKAKGDT